MKTVLVFDKSSDRRDTHCAVLAALGYSVFRYANGYIEAYPPGTVAVPTAYDLILLHSNDEPDFSVLGIAGLILSYGGRVLIEAGRVPRSVSAPDATLSAGEMKAFCDLVFSVPSTGLDDAIKIVWRDNEHGLALRLLCEAYAMPADGTGIRSYQPNENGAKAIPVHCPDPSTWFGLLGAVAPISETDKAAITAFGRLMGGAEEEAKNLARAIARKDTDISTPTGEFVTKVKKATPTTGGSK
jgi:hypothetical protein